MKHGNRYVNNDYELRSFIDKLLKDNRDVWYSLNELIGEYSRTHNGYSVSHKAMKKAAQSKIYNVPGDRFHGRKLDNYTKKWEFRYGS